MVLGIYIGNAQYLFETVAPRMQIANGPVFVEQLCLSEAKTDREDSLTTMTIPIYFSGWTMDVPEKIILQAQNLIDCSKYPLSPEPVSRKNYEF